LLLHDVVAERAIGFAVGVADAFGGDFAGV